MKKTLSTLIITLLMTTLLFGCGKKNTDENLAMENLPLEEATSPAPEEDIEIHQSADLDEPDLDQDIDDVYDLPDKNPHPLQIIFLGETNLDAHRNETGMAYLIGKGCDAKVFNLSIRGSTAAAYGNKDCEDGKKQNAKSLVGMSEILAGKADGKLISCTRASELIGELKIEETDYIVIMYGAQDFMKRVTLDGPDNNCCGGIDTYAGAFREAIINLRKAAPLADIVLVSPFFAWFYDDDNEYIGDGNTLTNGKAYLYEYVDKLKRVANEHQIIFADVYHLLGNDANAAKDYLSDGVHLSEAGRKMMADKLVEMILHHEMTFYN